MIRAIDVSHWQRDVDWAGLFARHSLDFGMAKCTEGTGFFDSYYVQNRDRVHALGKPFVAYHYATPSASSAATQARYFVGKAGSVDALCLDLEASKLDQAHTAAWQNAFGDALRQLSDVKTICYLGGYSQNGSGAGASKHFDFWMYPRYASMSPATQWPTAVNPRIDANTTGFARPPAPHIWQWTANLGGMDASVSNLTVEQLFGGTDPWEQIMAFYASKAEFEAAMARAPWTYKGALEPRDAYSFLRDGADAPTADVIAQAVLDKLPPAQTGGLTKQDVVDALTQVLVNGTGGTA